MIYTCTGSYLGGKFVQWYSFLNNTTQLHHIKWLNRTNDYYFDFFKKKFENIKNVLTNKDVLIVDSEFFHPSLNFKLLEKINSDIEFKLIIIHKDCAAPTSFKNIKVLSPEYNHGDLDVHKKFNYYLLNAGKQKLRKLSLDFWNYNKNQIRLNKFLCTNGTVKPHRTVFYNFLKETAVINNTFYSYLGYHINDTKISDVFDDTITYNNEFTKPIYLDTTWNIGDPLSEFTPLSIISNTYFDIVSCTQFENTEKLFTSEKVFRPFLSFVFPIFLGQSGLCNLLRNMGFDLFDDIINHSYDDEKNPSKRINFLFNEIIRLNKLSNLELFQIYKENHYRFLNNFEKLEELANIQIDELQQMVGYKQNII